MSGRIILLFCVTIGVQSISTPSITQCKKNEAACNTKNALTLYKMSVKGVPEWGIESLDPMYNKEIEGNLVIIKYKLHNSTLNGLSNCDVVNSKVSLGKSTLSFTLVCPYLEMYGVYEASGILIVVPIEGNGDYRIECKDYHIHIDSDIKISQRNDGKKYMSFKTFKYNAELKGGMFIDLKNLFNGQQNKLAETVLRFANEYWRPVSRELQGPVFGVNLRRLIKNFNKSLKHVPLDSLVEQ